MSVSKSVILVGMMGCGKSTLGKILASELNLEFIDSDRDLESVFGTDIRTYFLENNESAFRQAEHDYISSFSKKNFVMATGGGLPCFHGNMKILKQLGTVVYIECSVETLLKRLENQVATRPMLRDLTSVAREKKIKSLIQQRKDCYDTANIVVNGDLEIEMIISAILKSIA
jgi:shikimate kinase